MQPDDLVTVYTTTNPGEADVLKVVLNEQGIPCQLSNEHQAGFTGTFEIGLVVRAIDADRAAKIIESHGKALE